jgi:hypothetical protein
MEPATGRPDADAAGFLEFLERCHDALRQHTGGNPRPYLELWSHADDVSLMGGVGGHQVGIDEVSELLTAAAKTLNYETGAPRTSSLVSTIRSVSQSSLSGSLGVSTVRRRK